MPASQYPARLLLLVHLPSSGTVATPTVPADKKRIVASTGAANVASNEKSSLQFSSVLNLDTDVDVASTPPMGWNSWNHYHCAVNEAILRNMSKLYQTTGVAAAGYQYVNIDDCWQAQFRDKMGHLQAGDVASPHELCMSARPTGLPSSPQITSMHLLA
jgi:hypothetical protein